MSRPCYCGHDEEDHQIPVWLTREDVLKSRMFGIVKIVCVMCGDNHEYDPDYGGFLQHGVQNA